MVRFVPTTDSCGAAIRAVIRSPGMVRSSAFANRKIEMSAYLVGELLRKVGRIGTSNDLIDIFRGLPEKLVKIRSTRH